MYLFDNGLNPIPKDRYSTNANRKDRHHIFPKGLLNNADIHSSSYNSIANICLLVAEENQQVGSQLPRKYLASLQSDFSGFYKKLNRHLIPFDGMNGLSDRKISSGFRRFLGERTKLICDALEKEAGISLFRRK